MSTLPVAGPVEVSHGDRTYRFAKLNLEDWAAFQEHVKADMRAEIKDVDLPPAEKQKLYRELILQPLDVDSMLGFVQTLTGMRWLLHRSVSRHHDDVGIKEVGAIVGDVSAMADLIVRISDMPEAEEGSEESDPPT